MKELEIRRAVLLAKIFIGKAEKLQKAKDIKPDWENYPKESGALRRSSLDLTRQLAEMRNG